MKGRPTTTASEIREALEKLEDPFFCNWCDHFSDQKSRECHECGGSDDTFIAEDLEYWLEVMEDEANSDRGAA